jgi:hypothetical protein
VYLNGQYAGLYELVEEIDNELIQVWGRLHCC